MSTAANTHSAIALKIARAKLNALRSRRAKLEKELESLDQTIKTWNRSVHPGAARSLAYIALHGEPDELKNKLQEPVEVNARDRNGATALLLAVYRDNNEAAVRILLKAGADPNRAGPDGTTPLIAAVRPGQLKTVRALVESGALLNIRNHDGDSPLTNAATWGSDDIVDFLLTRGADAAMVDAEGLTAGQLAKQHGHLAVAQCISRYASGV